jgi:hypothetical protein
MVRPSRHILARLSVVVSLPCAAVLVAGLAGATLMPGKAWSADLRIPTKPAVQQETPSDRRKRLFEEFLRLRQKQNQ